MKFIIKILVLFFSTTLLGSNKESISYRDVNLPIAMIEKARIKADEALMYCKANKLNTDFCILIDMSLHSGVNRFFVWDFEKDTIINRFVVGHGCCDKPWSSDLSKDNPTFSNKDGSHCSALGKYKLGDRGYSDWGINVKYLMHGLEPTNNNALARTIVFHSWDMVSDKEVYPDGTPEGWGCPTISNNNMLIIDPKLKSAQKPVLMWIYK
ncbi:MAG: murein L,D-transpeptidase catalytic domain family protein [Bacteroidota bacterium]